MKISNRWNLLIVLLLACAAAPAAIAQQNELGLLIGGMKTGDRGLQSSQPVKAAFDGALTYEVNYAHRMVDGKVISVHWEMVVAGAPRTGVRSANLLLPRSYSTLFVTPGLKLKILPESGISPYIAAGFGYGRYSASELNQSNQPNTGDRTNNTYAFNYGGGVEWKVLGLLALRVEIRDFITGNPRLNAPLLTDKQHNVVAGGGIALRW